MHEAPTPRIHRHKHMHGLEKSLIALLTVWSLMLPWALGTMHVWSQLTSLGLSLVALGVSLIPRNYSALHTDGPAYRLQTWPKLLKFPLFWLGLALFLYIAIQALNPAWQYTRNATHWWLMAQQPVKWLPSSIDTPFAQMNAWRQLLIWAAPWFALCSAWIGITRRPGAQFLVITLALNGLLIAGLGLVQKFSGTKLIYWKFDFPGASIFSSFVYKNHAAAFLLPALAACVSLALWFAARGRRLQQGSTPAPLFTLAGLVIYAALIVSQSRLGTLLGTGLLLGIPALHLWHGYRSGNYSLHSLNWPVALITLLLLVGFGGWGLSNFNLRNVQSRFALLFRQEGEVTLRMRLYAYEATRRMTADHWAYGVGAGGFRFMFPEYQKEYPALVHQSYFGPYKDREYKVVRRLFFDHTHNDYLHILSELGLLGALILTGCLAVVLSAFTHAAVLHHPMALAGLLALLALLAYGLLDFPWHNPAVLGSMVLFLCTTLRWSELEQN